MDFQRNIKPYKKLQIGSGRGRKLFAISIGGANYLSPEAAQSVLDLIHEKQKFPNDIMYFNVERDDGARHFIEPHKLSGELLDYFGEYFQMP